MVYYLEQHKFFDDRLNIVKKVSSKFWIGRTFIDGKSTEKSSKTLDFKKAKKIIFKWYQGLEYKRDEGIIIHDIQFNKLFKKYIDERLVNKNTTFTKNINIAFNAYFKVFFHNRKINTIAKKTILEYVKWRISTFKKKNKREMARFTLDGDIAMLSGFFTWCYENEYKSKQLRLSKRWIKEIKSGVKDEGTGRTHFSIEENKILLTNSRRRVKESISIHNNKRYYFDREYLHQFIVFSTHSGTRVGETLNLKWKDIKERNKHKQDDKCNLKLKVSGKVGTRDCYTYYGSYFALGKIEELFKKYDIKISKDDYIFQRNFKKGLNELLHDCNLKFVEENGRTLRRDAKSFRSTYISWCLYRGLTHDEIRLNCGTSIGMIEKFYSKYLKIEKYKKSLTEISNTKSLYL